MITALELLIDPLRLQVQALHQVGETCSDRFASSPAVVACARSTRRTLVEVETAGAY